MEAGNLPILLFLLINFISQDLFIFADISFRRIRDPKKLKKLIYYFGGEAMEKRWDFLMDLRELD